MAAYMVQVAYTAEAWGNLVRSPQNRLEAVRPVAEKLGGRVENAWIAFGEYDAVLIIQMPDNVSAAAFTMAISAGRAVRACQTTPLLTIEAGMEAMRKAQGAGYQPPGS
jgi:uncharacterized protein with GYD domain